MKVEKNIMDVLQLYELSMAIGKSLDYTENCSSFLKLFLARKELRACWILKRKQKHYHCTYSLPDIECKQTPGNTFINSLDPGFESLILPAGDPALQYISPANLQQGSVAIFNLHSQGFLFVHSNRETPFTERELKQLRPIMQKLSFSLEGSFILDQREKLLLQLETQNQQLSDYAHVVSHDLKSPLRNINTLASWLQEDHGKALPKGAIQKIELMQENTERMEKLISGLLNYSSVRETENKAKEVDLEQVVEGVLGILPIPEGVEVKADPLPIAYGDPVHFQQLFQNLIDNAVKSLENSSGRIEIGCDISQTPPQFRVSDTGKGIALKYHKRIFRMFEKLDTDGTRSGIGLSIVSKILEHYQGKIWLHSKPGKGTTFYFTLGEQVTF